MLKLLIERDGSLEHGITNGRSMLLRDINDRKYPYKGEYADFDSRRRWEEHQAVRVEPTGVAFKMREWYAFFDDTTKEWDFSKAVDLSIRTHHLDERNSAREQDAGKRVEYFWRHLPRRSQAKFMVYGFVKYEDMLIIDDNGDPYFAMPHVFIDFSDKQGPFFGSSGSLHGDQAKIDSDDFQATWQKSKVFPDSFPEPEKGKIHELDELGLTGTPLLRLQHAHGASVLYAFDGKLDFLSENDLIHIPGTGREMDRHMEVTHVHNTTTVVAYTKGEESDYRLTEMEEYAGRRITPEDQMAIYEFIEVYIGNKYLTYVDRM